VFSDETGNCLPNGTVSPTQVVKALAAAVPDSTFVAAAETIREPRDARLSANVRIAEDGSRQVISHYDLEREAECNPRLHADVGYGCVPEDRAYIEYFFANDACDVPAAYHPAYAQQVCDRAPKIIQNSGPYYTDGYYEVGEEITGTIFRKDTDCVPYVSPGDPGATYFAVGKEVPWSAFAQLSSKNEGAGRIAVQVIRGADDELISREGFYDTELDAACASGQNPDGKMRCLPLGAYGVNEFADDECSQALLNVLPGEDPPPGAAFIQANAPGGGQNVFRLGTKIATPAQTWQMNGLDCEPRSASDSLDYYSTTIVAPAELQLVTFEVE
jgi:hypothetical protein